MTVDTKLAEMLATRLCHDLTGPIGAVNNGAEFLDEEGFNMENEAVQLIVSSAHEAVNRLMFYRQAYGRVGDAGEACLADKKIIALDFFSGTKIKLDWPDSHTDAAGIPVSQYFIAMSDEISTLAVANTLTRALQKAGQNAGDRVIAVTPARLKQIDPNAWSEAAGISVVPAYESLKGDTNIPRSTAFLRGSL